MKNEKISLRGSNEEKEKIRKEAEERNLSISDYMIKKVCYETKQETDNTQKIIYEHRFYSLFNELKAKKISRKKYIKRIRDEQNTLIQK